MKALLLIVALLSPIAAQAEIEYWTDGRPYNTESGYYVDDPNCEEHYVAPEDR